MNSKIPANFNIVKSTIKKIKALTPIDELSCDWLSDPKKWDKEKFKVDIVTFIEQTQGVNSYPNMILIGMLAHQIDLYVHCSQQIAKGGLVEEYNKGATSGPSLFFSMADKTLNRVLQLMKELGLTPSHRVGTVRSTSTDRAAFEQFMAGP